MGYRVLLAWRIMVLARKPVGKIALVWYALVARISPVAAYFMLCLRQCHCAGVCIFLVQRCAFSHSTLIHQIALNRGCVENANHGLAKQGKKRAFSNRAEFRS